MLRTPHSGCRWNGRRRPYFEGWYYRITLPPGSTDGASGCCPAADKGQTFAFMYSIQNLAPGCGDAGGHSWQSAVQILGPEERYFHRMILPGRRFWGWRDRWGHGHDADPLLAAAAASVEGYRATHAGHAGCFHDPDSGRSVRWYYRLEAEYGWGEPSRRQRSTAGWLSRFQIFEPGWQILMAHGRASGWLEWSEPGAASSPCRFRFSDAPAYAEKNWGGSFPERWFWIQCNAFEQHPDLTLTSGGGIRQVLGRRQALAMVAVHWRGRFDEFVPWKGPVRWSIAPWGEWRLRAERGPFTIALRGTTSEPGVWVRVPTATGLEWLCRDTTRGDLSVRLWHGRGSSRRLLLSARSRQAGLEVGGQPWQGNWSSAG